MTKLERNERSLDFWAKLGVIVAVFMLGFSVGYFEGAREAASIVLGSR